MSHNDETHPSGGRVGDGGGESRSTLGRYINLCFLGQGGMARVYSAYDPQLGRTVALKLIRGDDPELRVRLQSEARAQAGVDHPGICKIYEVGEVENEPYIAMQLIHGPSLREAAADMTLEQKLNLMKDVSLAVHAAHRAGLIHRDLKPANILVEKGEDGRWIPYVVDFGLARDATAPGMTASGVIVGSPAYMSPEQARGEIRKLDRRSDVYSLGVTLYELLSGKLPFEAEASLELILQVLQDDPVPLRTRDGTLPQELELIVQKCLEKDPSRRYESARALAEDLERYLAGDPVAARPADFGYRLRKKIRKHKAVVAAASVAIGLVVIFGAIGIRTQIAARRQAALANQLGQEVKEMEGILRFAQMLPLHDVVREKKIVRNKVAQIESRISSMGSLAEGPGNFAIGRGYLALQEYELARKHLEAAWKAYPDPQVASALGLVMGLLYQKDLAEADLIQNKEQKEARRKLSEQNFRAPALEYLKAGSRLRDEHSDYVQGLIAFYEKNHAQALRNASEAVKKAPGFFEAHQLSGEVLQDQGKAAYSEGRYQDAGQYYDRAEAEFSQAAFIARSDARAYVGLCTVQLNRVDAAIYNNPEGVERYARAGLDLCAQALKADSESVDARLTEARIYIRWGEHAGSLGSDPRELLNHGIESVHTALRLESNSYMAYYSLGIANRLYARYEQNHGMDAAGSLDRSIAAYRKSIDINPAYANTYSSLANVYITRAQIEWDKGKSPLASLDAAITNLKTALKLDPKLAAAFTNMGVAYNNKTSYELDNGMDPRASADEAIRAFTRSLELAPNNPLVYSNMGNPYLFKGQYALMRAESPEEYFRKAIENYSRAVELNPGLANAVVNLGLAYNQLASYRRDSGQDARAEFEKAIELGGRACGLTEEPFSCSSVAISNYEYGLLRLRAGEDPRPQIEAGLAFDRRAFRANPESPEAWNALAQLKLLDAQRMIARKADAAATLLEAEQAARKAIQSTPGYAPYAITAGLIYCELAEGRQRLRRSPEESIDRGLSVVEEGRKAAKELPQFYALRGALLAIRAAAGDEASAQPARDSLAHAFSKSPTLVWYFGRYQKLLP